MPKVLTRLRIDEISSVDKAANGGAKVVLMKRATDEPGFYHKLFASAPVRKAATYRGGSGSRLHHIEGLTRSEAIHWLAHDPSGRALALARGRSESLGDLADLLVEASLRPTEVETRKDTLEASSINKEDNHMREFDVYQFAKGVADAGVSVLSEHQLTELIKDRAAKERRPGESSAAAFCRIYEDDSGLALRKAIQVAKGLPHPHVAS
jgi:hypothetical protein